MPAKKSSNRGPSKSVTKAKPSTVRAAKPSRAKQAEKTVNIRKVQNGFTINVSTDNDFRGKTFVAADKKAANALASKLISG